MTVPLLALLLAVPRLLYPVDAPPQVTATVGTYRIGHHHAGLDLGTEGRQGIRARAALDGEIFRIARSHIGYGRSVFIRHPGGLTTVYGHLERFSPALDALARAEEKRRGQYAFEKLLDPPLPVKQGDFLGYVGTSGTDLIHLHFELRVDNVPVNPLTHGLTLPDTQPPVFSRLLFLPRDAGAQIEGQHAAREFPLTEGPAPAVVQLAGRVGLLAEVTDHIDGSPRNLEPLRLELLVDGRPAHSVLYERVSYGQKSATELDYLAERRADGSGRFHRLYRDPVDGPRLLVWPGPTLADFGGLPVGPHSLTIITADAAGHETRLDLGIEVVPPRAPCAAPPAGGPTDAPPTVSAAPARVTDSRWTESTRIIPVPEACAADFKWALRGLPKEPPTGPAWRWTQVAEGPALAIDLEPIRDTTLVLETSGGGRPARAREFEAISITPGAAITALGGRVHLTVGREALFAPYLTDVFEATNPGTPELVPLGPLAVFRQTWRPVRGPSKLSLARPAEAAGGGVALYFNEGKRFWRIGAKAVSRGKPRGDGKRKRKGEDGRKGEADGRGAGTSAAIEGTSAAIAGTSAAIEGTLVHLGSVGLMRDTTPPTVGEARLEAHPAGARLVIPVADAGSGLDADSLRLKIDGEIVYPEYFHAYGQAVYRPWERFRSGKHVVSLTARDSAGNGISRRLEFRISP